MSNELLKEQKFSESMLAYCEQYGCKPEETAFQDTECYKNYVSRYDVSGMKVALPEGFDMADKTGMFTKLFFASLSWEYDMRLDEAWKASPVGEPAVEIYLFAETKDGEKSQRSMKTLSPSQIYQFHLIVMNEMVQHSIMLAQDKAVGNMTHPVNKLRQERLQAFEQRKKQLLAEAEWHRKMAAGE